MAKEKFTWTPDIEEAIIERHSLGESLLDICDGLKGLPTISQAYGHERADKEFRDRMRIATEQYARVKFEECIKIADDSSGDWRRRITRNGKDVVEEVDHENIQRSKLKIETRLKALAKIDPERYGGKQSVEISGKGGGPIETKDVSDLDLARRMAFILEKGKRQAVTVNGSVAVTRITPPMIAVNELDEL